MVSLLLLIFNFFSSLIIFAKGYLFQKNQFGDFPGGPVVRPSRSNAEGVGSIPGGGAKIPHASWLGGK